MLHLGGFTQGHFCSIMHQSCGKYWFTKLYKCSKCWHIYCFLNHISEYQEWFPQESVFQVLGCCEAHGSRYRLSKFWFLLESSSSIIGTKYWQVFLWLGRLTLFPCYPGLIIMVSHSFKSMGSSMKKSSWFSSQINKLSAFLDTLVSSRSSLPTSQFITENIEDLSLQGWLIKLIRSHGFIKDGLKWN